MQWMRSHDPAECPRSAHSSRDCIQAKCDHSVLSTSTNVLVLVRANELAMMSLINTILAILSVLFAAVSVVGLIINCYDNDCTPAPGNDCDPATTPQIFHNLEFWATFVFNVATLLALNYSPKVLSNQYENPTRLKLIVLSSTGMSFLSCLLVTINLKKFAVSSHLLEYGNELLMTIFDGMLLLSLTQGRHPKGSDARGKKNDWYKSVLMVLVATIVACVQLGIYTLSGWTEEGKSKGEKAAHYLEFVFNIVSAGITFWFTMDNRFCADKRLQQLMYSQ